MQTVTTTKDEYFAQSCAFNDMTQFEKLNIMFNQLNATIDHLVFNQVDTYIQTNSGGKFVSLHDFWCMASDHGYDITSRAPNVPHQNGITKRSHSTQGTNLMHVIYSTS